MDNNTENTNVTNNDSVASEREYKYDAFISYRHLQYDQYVARNIHSKLESFKLPKSLRKKTGKTGINRVFRDNEELELTNSLEDYLVQALYDSKSLIVICSPELKESKWCRKEIETFKNFHGGKNIFPILIDGAIETSFPEELLKDGDRDIEPFAADVRGGKRKYKKKIKKEFLRIVAPIMGVSYDDLKQRKKEAAIKRKLAISFATTAIAVIVGFVFAIAAFTIKHQNAVIREAQAKSIARLAMEKMNNNDYIEGRELAYESVTESDGIKMPQTADGQLALSKSLGVYNLSYEYSPIYNFKMPGVIKNLQASDDGKNILIGDNLGNVYVWDALIFKNKLKITELYGEGKSYNENYDDNRVGFVGNKYLFMIDRDDKITLFDLEKGEKVGTLNIEKADSAYCVGGRYLIIDGFLSSDAYNRKLFVYDTEEMKGVCEIPTDALVLENFATYGNYFGYGVLSSESDDETPLEESKVYSIGEKYKYEIYNCTDGKKLTEVQFNADIIDAITLDQEGNLFIATTHFIDGYSNMKYVARMYSSKTGELLWADEIHLNVEKVRTLNNDKIALWGGNNFIVFDAKTGNIYCQESYLSRFLDVEENNNSIWVLTEEGSIFGLSLDDASGQSSLIDLSYYGIKINGNDFKEALIYNNLIYALPDNEEMLIMYQNNSNKGCYPYSGELYEPNAEMYGDGMSPIDAVNQAKDYNVTDNEHVTCAVKNIDNGEFYFVKNDGTVDVYDTRSKEYKASFTVKDSGLEYLGDDIYGNHYFRCIASMYNLSYCVNPDFEIIAEFNNMTGLSLERDRIIIDDTYAYEKDKAIGIAYPIYTLDELIEIAAERIGIEK